MLFSQKMNFDESATEIPSPIVEEVHLASKSVADPETAKALFEKLIPILETGKPNRTFALACGMLMEKQRNTEGMIEFWGDLLSIFPGDLTALRMLMRWYRRKRIINEGIEKVQLLFPECHSNLVQASDAILAFGELRAFREIDEMMAGLEKRELSDRSIKMRYLKILFQQSRYIEARQIADAIPNSNKMGQSSQDLLASIFRRAAKLEKIYTHDASDVFENIISLCPQNIPVASDTIGPITMFTGQLGTGGAERQLTRIAVELNQQFQKGSLIGGIALGAAPSVCVKHASAASGGDFFLPVLKRAGVTTNILQMIEPIDAYEIPQLNSEISNLLELLPSDVSEQTRKLIPYFHARKTKVAYLWQDGGVLSAAVAALIAGVPRIVTSFRGLPPNLRPSLMRTELEPLYLVLSKRPEVTFTANSQCAATAYENWLKLAPGDISVIPNAIPKVQPQGSESDGKEWADIENRSSGCTKTVVGIFRFDENKRPIFWIDMAAEFAKLEPKTRFIIVGSGHLFSAAKERIQMHGLQDRIFLMGVKKNVGFYLHHADLVMHLAKNEGLPNVLIEAQLAGKPVLATPAGGSAEIIKHQVTGYLLKCADEPLTEEVQTALFDLLRDDQRLALMGEKGLRRAEPRYLPENVLAQTIQIFRSY